MKRWLVLAGFVGLGFAPIVDPGATGYSFLKLGIGVRPVAMGNAFTALSDDATAIFWNPAGLGVLESYYAEIMAMDHLAYWQYYNLSASLPLGRRRGSLGFGVSYLGASDQVTDENGEVGAAFTNSDMLLDVGYGNAIGRERTLAVGGAVKFVRSQLYTYSAYGVLADVGIILRPFKMLYLGTVLRHAGSPRRFIERLEYPPVNFRQGVALKLPFRQNQFTLSCDYSVYPDIPATFSAGAEIRIREPKFLNDLAKAALGQNAQFAGFSLMGGYQSGYQDLGFSGWTLGFAIEMMLVERLYFNIGAVYQSYGYLGNSERIGLGINYVPVAKGSKK